MYVCILDVALECAGFLQGLGHPTSVMIRSKPLKGFDEVCDSHTCAHVHYGHIYKYTCTSIYALHTNDC